MRRPLGRRSSCDVVRSWICSHGHINRPKRHEFFAIPTLICACGCKEEYEGEFDFSLGDIKVNGHKLLGDPITATTSGETCVPLGFSKQLEITKRIKAIMQNKEPSFSHVLRTWDLVHKYEKIVGTEADQDAGTEVILMARILKEQGIRNWNGTTVYKASNVSAISKDDIQVIMGAIADGFPLHAGLLEGRKLRSHRYCRPYMPPSYDKAKAKADASGSYIPAHAVVLVGAGRKKKQHGRKGRIYYYFLNSWNRFCVRRNKYGKVICHGIGKVDATCLYRNVIRISRFKEEQTNTSFVSQAFPVPEDCHNMNLLTSGL